MKTIDIQQTSPSHFEIAVDEKYRDKLYIWVEKQPQISAAVKTCTDKNKILCSWSALCQDGDKKNFISNLNTYVASLYKRKATARNRCNATPGKKKKIKEYIFNIDDVNKIDLARISRENQENDVIVHGCESVLLMLRDEFIKQFDAKNGFKIWQTYLSPEWGHKTWNVVPRNSGIDFVRCDEETIQYHRAFLIHKTDLARSIGVLKKAREYRRKLTVRVEII